jgi:hypothetical protein
MKRLGMVVLIAVMAAGCGMVGCGDDGVSNVKESGVKESGPVLVVKDYYSYHRTIKIANGELREFYICSPTGLLEEGTTIEIKFTGDGSDAGSDHCANIISVVVLKESAESSEPTVAKAMLSSKGYFDISAYYDKGANDSIATEHGYQSCDTEWYGKPKGSEYTEFGVLCKGKDGDFKIVKTH